MNPGLQNCYKENISRATRMCVLYTMLAILLQKFMLPKRGFWKTKQFKQTIGRVSGFGLLLAEKCFEDTPPTDCSTVQNLRLGSITCLKESV